MELPNHKVIKLHNFDTPETIRNKIAISYNVEPKFLNKFKIPPKLYMENKWPNITITTIIEALEEFLKKNKTTSFDKFYNQVSTKFDLTPQELVSIWVKYYIVDISEGDSQLIHILESELKQSLNNLEMLYPSEFSGIHMKHVDIKFDISQKMIKDMKDFDDEIDNFIKIKSYETTPFEQKKQYITITIESDSIKYPFEYLFDKIILNENIPLVVYNEYSKIYKTFVLNGNIPTYENSIVLLYKKSQLEYIGDDEDDEEEEDEENESGLPTKNVSKIMWYKLYNVITIRRDNLENIVLEMDIENNVNIDSIVDNLKKILNWDIDISTFVTTNKISGDFFTLKQIMDPVITKDIILFHPVLKNIMYSNDNLLSFDLNFSVSTKYKYKNIIHYIDPITKTKFTCHISTRAATRNDMIKYMSKDLKIGEPITVFKIIRGANVDVITYFQNIIGKLVTIYNQHSVELTKEYSKYLSGVNERIFTPKKETLTDILPTVFPEQYSRLCSKQKIPHIISSDKYQEDDPAQLEFPKDDDNSKYFECNTEDFPFIGLVANKLANKLEYPFLPCCFKQNQKNNTESNYQKYYNENEVVGKQKQEYERILQTQKFAKFGTYGILPESISQLFSILDKNNEYYRRGMHFQNPILGMSSFLECVLDALNWNNILKYGNDETEREKIIKEERNSIANFIKNSGLCKQECYNLTLSDIQTNIQNINHYLSPSLYIRALEEFYNVNIFIFQRDNKSPKGNLIIPNHEPSCNYLFSPLKSRQSIFLYEHTGGIWDKKYSCELIIRFNPKTLKTVTLFNYDDDIVISIYKQLLQMYPNYQSNTLILPVDPPGIKNITSQYIDNFGKVRYLTYSNPNATIYCQPIPPLNVPVNKELPVIENTNDFVNKYQLHKHGDNAFITDNGFQIFAKPSTSYTNSNINPFVYNKRISIHLLEYLLYLYSKYLHENKNLSVKTSENVTSFLNKHTIINTTGNIQYNIHFLTQHNPQIVEIDSIEMRSKLNYMIRVHLLNNRRLIMNYHTQNYLNNFYNTILDFTEYPNQELICTKILYTIYNNLYETKLQTLPPENYTPHLFFFRYNNINYLAQPTKTLDEALLRVYNWRTQKSNTIKIVQEIPAFPFICIPFSNNQYSEQVKVTGGTSIGDVFILFVFTPKTQYYVALLNI